MNTQSKKITNMFARYLTIILLGLGNLYVIYKVLTPITIQVLNKILSIFTSTTLEGNIIHLNQIGIAIEIVPACVAGAAFYLLLILIMSTANIKPKTRGKAIVTAFAIFFTLNMLRILMLVPMVTASYFETVHWISWHLISIVFVVGTWFSIVKIYKIKAIPVYSDLKYIKSLMPKKKKKSKSTAKRSTGKAVLKSTAKRSK